MTIFRDRRDAGRQLARVLLRYRNHHPIVLGLPRGGVVVADEVARALNAPLDVVIVRKLGAPGHPEFAVGAMAPGGVLIVDETTGIRMHDLKPIVDREHAELRRRMRTYGRHTGLPRVTGRTVLLVDDGIATGHTAEAAIEAVRRQQPRRLVLAAPVAPPSTIRRLSPLVDEIVCLQTPTRLQAIGEWYADFRPVTDAEVIALLNRSQADAQARQWEAPSTGRTARASRSSFNSS